MDNHNGSPCEHCGAWVEDGTSHKCYSEFVYDEKAWQFTVQGEPLILVSAHCDNRVLHSPGYCNYCDQEGAEAQQQRLRLGVSFTNQPDRGKYPDPALTFRDEESINGWGGNQPHGDGVTEEDIEHFAEIERPSSRAFYGDTKQRHGEIRPGLKHVPGTPWWRRIFRR